jgi:hypothetical protein
MKNLMMTILLLAAFVSPAQAEWNPDTKAMEMATKGHAFDLLMTGGAIFLPVAQTVTEANPIGAAIIPLKLAATYGALPFVPESQQMDVAKRTSSIAYGAGMANAALWMGAASTVAYPIGFVTGLYLLGCDAHMLPASICPFTETIIEEMDRRIARGGDLVGFIITQNEAKSLVEELGYLPAEYKGIWIKVEEVVHFEEEPELYYDRA